MYDVDVLISGAGLAGLIAAAALARAGASVLVVDPDPQSDRVDQRSTAYLLPAQKLLDEIGLWGEIAPHTTPLDALRVIDTSGTPAEPRTERTFLPEDLGHAHFGWNIPNSEMRTRLIKHLKTVPIVTLALGFGFGSMLTRTTSAQGLLSDGTRWRARLVVGADGRASAVRTAAGIEVETWRYGQKALAFHATHTEPHQNVSTEIYNQGGAFTTVPLPDLDGQPCSAIVWMMDGPKAKAVTALPEQDFNLALNQRSTGFLGSMSRATPLGVWPVVTQRARSLTAERVVLIAEAAHVLPPIGAQGLNTSLSDVSALYRIAQGGIKALGDAQQLAAYTKARATDTDRRARVIDLFNRICKSGAPFVQAARSTGLAMAHDIKPVRQGLMRLGLGR